MKKTYKKILSISYLLIFLLLSSLIIAFSLAPSDVSSNQSGFILNIVLWGLSLFGYTPNQDALALISILVRKLIGHFGLFFVDGMFAYLNAVSFIKAKKYYVPLLIALSTMVVLASLSEVLQLLASGRAGLFSDVILDIAGAILGVSLIYFIDQAKKKEHRLT